MKTKNSLQTLALAIAVAALVSVLPALGLGNISASHQNFPSLHSSFQKTAKADLSGKWDLNVTTDGGPVSAKAEFKVASDGTITGTVESEQYGSSKISSGSVTDANFAIKFSISADGNAIEVTMSGTFDEKSLKGSGSAGDNGFSFTGTRSSSAQ
jgi:hypothetical protein